MKMNTAMGVVGWIVMGVQTLTQVLSAVFNAHDKAKQKEIDKEIENVEKLEKALEDLEERLEIAKKTSDLPDKPDYEKINKFVASVNERIVKGEI